MRSLLLLSFFLVFLISCTHKDQNEIIVENQNMILWYDEPAAIWEEALPVGNGRLGAMVYGRTNTELIKLNEETIWSGEPGNNIQPDLKEYLPEIRQLIFDGKYQEAQDLANKVLPRRTPADNNYGMCYQPANDLKIKFADTSEASNYKRMLDIQNAVATTTFTKNDVIYKQEVISSFTEDVIAIHYSSNKEHALDLSLSVDCIHDEYQIETVENILSLQGKSSNFDN